MPKSRTTTAKRSPLIRFDPDKMPLTGTSKCAVSGFEGSLEDVSSTTAFPHEANGDCVEKNAEWHQFWKRSQRPTSLSSLVSKKLEERGSHTFLATRRPPETPRLQKWSPMSFVRLSMIVVKLALAIVVTLPFMLREADTGGVAVGDYQRYSEFNLEIVARTARYTTATSGHSTPISNGVQQHDKCEDDRQEKTGSVRGLVFPIGAGYK